MQFRTSSDVFDMQSLEKGLPIGCTHTTAILSEFFAKDSKITDEIELAPEPQPLRVFRMLEPVPDDRVSPPFAILSSMIPLLRDRKPGSFEGGPERQKIHRGR